MRQHKQLETAFETEALRDRNGIRLGSPQSGIKPALKHSLVAFTLLNTVMLDQYQESADSKRDQECEATYRGSGKLLRPVARV